MYDSSTAAQEISTGRQSSLPIVDQQGGRIRLTPRDEPRFVGEALLGTGGTGEVVRAADLDIGRRVAIKRLRDDRFRPSDVARFVREIQLVGSLEHPNIVPLHDVGTDADNRVYAVMKFVDGMTLNELVNRLREGDATAHARWDHTARTRLFLEICRGVAFAHDHDVLHRDIKPSNVMVGPEGEAQILDWGLAKRRDTPDLVDSFDEEPSLHAADLDPSAAPTWVPRSRRISQGSSDFDTREGAVFGTPPYMSPEQARGEEFDERSEVFALGLLFWELLTLADPLPGVEETAKQVDAASRRIVPHIMTMPRHASQAPVPGPLAWFVFRATRPQPEDRFPSVDAMIEELRRVADGSFKVQCPSTLQHRALGSLGRLVDRNPMLVPFVAFATLVSLVSVGVAIGLAIS
ncbi:MAG: serine/threonine-protein kinase [Myxococcota bacterium]